MLDQLELQLEELEADATKGGVKTGGAVTVQTFARYRPVWAPLPARLPRAGMSHILKLRPLQLDPCPACASARSEVELAVRCENRITLVELVIVQSMHLANYGVIDRKADRPSSLRVRRSWRAHFG